MPRQARMLQQAVCYHVFNRGINKASVFVDEADYIFFTRLVLEYKARCKARIYHWAWMPNHYHMVVEIVYGHLRSFAGGIQQVYAHYHHARHGTCGLFWQGRFKSPPIETGEYLERCGRYVERNAVRAHLVELAWEYPWCSARAYVLGQQDGITDPNPHMGLSGMTDGVRRQYAEALQSVADDVWMKSLAACSIIGSPEFARRLKISAGRHRHKPGGRRPGVSNCLQTTGR